MLKNIDDLLAKRGGELEIFSGSNRQSFSIDYINGKSYTKESFKGIINGAGSAFPVLRDLAGYFKGKFNTFLLADLFNDVPPGTSLKEMAEYIGFGNLSIAEQRKILEKKSSVDDQSKVILLYAQIHYMASSHPNKDIGFYFFDDHHDILDKIVLFFNTYPALLPDNVVLYPHRYDGQLEEFQPICGKGKIDFEYQQTVKEMSKCCLNESEKEYPFSQQKIDMSQHISNKNTPADTDTDTKSFLEKKALEQSKNNIASSIALLGGGIVGAALGLSLAAAAIFFTAGLAAPIVIGAVIAVSIFVGGMSGLGLVAGAQNFLNWMKGRH